MKILFDLFFSFCRVGGLTFGGGYAMLPMLLKEIVEKKKWATEDEMMNYFAVGQCTPGVIAVNTATFVGYKTKGIAGGIAATLGVITPSFIIICIIASFLNNFADIIWVKHAFSGIRVAVAVLIADAVIKMAKKGIKDMFGAILCAIVFVCAVMLDISPVFYVIISAILGIIKGKRGALK